MADPSRRESPERRPRVAMGTLASVRWRLVVLLAAGLACIGAGVLGGLLYGAASPGAGALVDAPVAARPAPLPEAAPDVPIAAGTKQRSFLSQLIPPPAEGGSRDPRVPRTVGDLARRLPLERKAAQVLLVGFRGTDATAPVFAQLAQRDLGGVVVEAGNYVDPNQLIALTAAVAAGARQARHVAPLVMTSQEGGQFSEIPDLPPDRPPSRIGSPEQAARSARRSARALEAFGFNSVLAPVIDVGLEGGGGGGARLYSDEPDRVADYAEATIGAYRRAGIIAAPKHFPGLGAATQPTEAGPAPVGLSIRELAQRDLRPFAAAVDARAQAMLVGHGLYPAEDYVVPASLSKDISTGLLREQLGFRGLAITDDLASPAISTSTKAPDATVEALKAGADMVWISGPRGDQESAYVAILNAIRKGELSRRRLDEAVTRVLVAKRQARLIR